MKPSQEGHGIILETAQEIDDSCEVLLDLPSGISAALLLNKLDTAEGIVEAPIELTPEEGPLLLEVLELASEHHSTEEPRRSRIHSMLNEYESYLE